MKTDKNYTPSILTTKASPALKKEIEDEINKPGPDEETARAKFKRFREALERVNSDGQEG